MNKPNGVRIQKYLSDRGITSRRKAEVWLKAGFISVNGQKVTVLGTKVNPSRDEVTIDPAAYRRAPHQYFLFNKPKGIVTVNAERGEKEIRHIVRLPRGVTPVGRLDKDTTGLILLTDDGVAARRIMDPDFGHEKEYEVTFYDAITEDALRRLSQGMVLFGERTKPIKITRIDQTKVRMILQEGRNRQIRRMAYKVGFPVKDLKRVRLLCFEIGDMPEGRLMPLTKEEVQVLYEELKMDKRSRSFHKPKNPGKELPLSYPEKKKRY